jgi:microcystin-dependent protein
MFRINIKACARLGTVLLPAVFLSGVQPAFAQGSEPFVGQMLFAGFNFAPNGWQLCDGSLLSIAVNTVLFDLIGTTYGGNGTTTFAVPDMRGRIPIHQGSNGSSNYVIGQMGGNENVTLTFANLPAHSHSVSISGPLPASSAIATSAAPGGNAPANTARNLSYATSAPNVTLGSTATATGTSGASGGNLPFPIIPPYTAVTCVISLFGVFPSQN